MLSWVEDFVLREVSSQDLFALTGRLFLAVLAGDFLDPLQIPTWPQALGGQQDRRRNQADVLA